MRGDTRSGHRLLLGAPPKGLAGSRCGTPVTGAASRERSTWSVVCCSVSLSLLSGPEV